MARTTRESSIQSRTARGNLVPRTEPYYRSLQRGLALGYRRGKYGGSWLARMHDPVRAAYSEIKIGPADDESGRTVQGLTYDEATQRAREIFAEEVARRTSGVRPGSKRTTIADVLDRYVEGYTSGAARRGEKPGRDLKNLNSILNVHIRPALGHLRLDQINSDLLEKFKAGLAKSPKLSRTGMPANSGRKDIRKQSNDPGRDQEDDREAEEERLRKRKARANRIITPLRAALNYAIKQKLIASDSAWKHALKPFPDVDGITVRYLTLEECQRLQNHCDDDFRPIIMGALFTGGRYGSLRLLRANDVDFVSRTAVFRATKSGKRQSVKLTIPACKFLKVQIAGKSGSDYVFVKDSGKGWRPSDQARRIGDACSRAAIRPPITFHELRDTFASHLVMGGVPILTVSQLLGHADVRVTQKHYAHLAPDYLQRAVDESLPDFSLR